MPQLQGADVGEDDADQKADERDDRQRLRAHLLQREQQLRALEARLAADEPDHAQKCLAEEREERACFSDAVERRRPDTRQEEWPPRARARVLALGHRGGEGEQAPDAFGERGQIGVESPPLRLGGDRAQKNHQAAVPGFDAAGVERHAREPAVALRVIEDGARERKPGVERPASAQAQQHCVARATGDV